MATANMTSVRVDNAGPTYLISGLSDDELLAGTRRLVGKSNQILAALLAHLAEVESRGVHRNKACSSLYAYCVYELRFSEDAASRRVCAARLVKRFPTLLDAIASGKLHLTGLLMLGPYITPQNQLELLARAQFRTKKELAKLVRLLDPLPDMPAQIVPLGPTATPIASAAKPDWQSFAQSLCPNVRELPQRDRPANWANKTSIGDEPTSEPLDAELSPSSDPLTATPARNASSCFESRTPAPARDQEPSALIAPQRYRIQFTASEEHVELVERAQALLSQGAKNGDGLAEIHLRAMRTLVAELEKQRYGAARPRPSSGTSSSGTSSSGTSSSGISQRGPQRHQRAERAEPIDGRGLAPVTEDGAGAEIAEAPRRRVRYVPAAERRAVFERDGARCSYIDARGQRCRETRCLELHHLIPFARHGEHMAANLAIFCRAHNTLAAEADFGRKFVEAKCDEVPHESWAAQRPP